VANDLTKLYENVRRGRLSELITALGRNKLQGEFVVVIAGAGDASTAETNGARESTMADADTLARLMAEVQTSAKYRQVVPELIRRLGAQELDRRRSFKEAVKATKNKLHQVGAVYFPAQARYERWLAHLAAAASPEALRAACHEIMAGHASTRERLPLLDQLYARALAELAPVHSVIDVACGFHPLAIPWMPLAPGARYQAIDIYVDLMTFLDAALPLLGVEGQAVAADVLQSPRKKRRKWLFSSRPSPAWSRPIAAPAYGYLSRSPPATCSSLSPCRAWAAARKACAPTMRPTCANSSPATSGSWRCSLRGRAGIWVHK
jgi:hypothetical protein